MSEDVTTNQDGDVNTDQENKMPDFDSMSAEELNSFVEEKKKEAIKLNAITERKGKKLQDGNDSSNDEQKEITQTPASETERIERLELFTKYNYPDEVIDHVMGLGGKNALSNPITKKVADEMAQDIKSQQAADIPDGPEGSVDRRIKVSDLEGLSAKEMEKILPHKEV